jgi:hypothetical protein
MLNMASAVAFNRRDLIWRGIEPGCVLYMTAENPNKFRDRLILLAWSMASAQAAVCRPPTYDRRRRGARRALRPRCKTETRPFRRANRSLRSANDARYD